MKLRGLVNIFVKSSVPAWAFTLTFVAAVLGGLYFVEHFRQDRGRRLAATLWEIHQPPVESIVLVVPSVVRLNDVRLHLGLGGPLRGCGSFAVLSFHPSPRLTGLYTSGKIRLHPPPNSRRGWSKLDVQHPCRCGSARRPFAESASILSQIDNRKPLLRKHSAAPHLRHNLQVFERYRYRIPGRSAR